MNYKINRKLDNSYKSLQERFYFISSYEDPDNPHLYGLNEQMKNFYRFEAIKRKYYEISESKYYRLRYEDFLKNISEFIKPGQLLIEFSCGACYGADLFHRYGYRYIGIDLAIPALQRYKLSNPKVQLVGGDVYRLPIRSCCADIAVSLYSIEHTVWPALCLDEMFRVVKPGGYIVLIFPEYVTRKYRYMKSVVLGRSCGGILAKFLSGYWLDGILSFMELQFIYLPKINNLHRRIFRDKQFSFLINTSPRCLTTYPRTVEDDAIYFACEEEIAKYLTNKGCTIGLRGSDINKKDKFNIKGIFEKRGFVLARTPHRLNCVKHI